MAAVTAFPMSGPKEFAQPAPNAPNNIEKIDMKTYSPLRVGSLIMKIVPK